MLVVYSLSRLARSTRDAIDIAERLARAGADLVSITEKIDTTTSMGRFFFTTIAALAQLERDQISERTCMALAHKRSKRQRVSGQIPYGSRLAADGVNLVDEPQEQRAVAIIQRMRGAGSTTREIEKELLRQGHRPRNGWHWQGNALVGLFLGADADIADGNVAGVFGGSGIADHHGTSTSVTVGSVGNTECHELVEESSPIKVDYQMVGIMIWRLP